METGLQTFILVFSNAIYIFPVFFFSMVGHIYIATQLFISAIISAIYHQCRGTGTLCFGQTVETWRKADYFYANNDVILIFLFLGDFISVITKKIKIQNKKQIPKQVYTRVLGFVKQDTIFVILQPTSFALVLLIVENNLFNNITFYLVLSIGLLILFIKWVLIDEGKYLIKERIYWPALICGIILIPIAVIIFFIGDSKDYPLLHSLWHILGALGLFFFAMGLGRHLKGWFGFREILLFNIFKNTSKQKK